MDRTINRLVAAATSGDRRAASTLNEVLREREGEPDADEALMALARATDSPVAVEVLAAAVYEQRFARAEIRRILFVDGEVEEALQETVLAMVSALPRFRGDAAFRTWASRIGRNQAIGILRRKRATTDSDVDVNDQGEVASFSSVLAQRSDVSAAIGRLPEDMAAVVRLRDLEQHTYADIAEQLEIPMNTVRSRLARGRARLKADLDSRWEQ